MQFGINLPVSGKSASVENIIKVARWAEELGFHSLWASDHVVLPETVGSFYPYGRDGRWTNPADTHWLDPLLALSWAGQAAPHCMLGTNVLVAPLRNPMLLAKQLATLDVLSNGRVLLGIGAGWMEEEFNLIGVPFADRGSRTSEMVRLMRAFWSGKPVDFQGKYWQVANCAIYPLPVRRTIPIYWGGHTEAALRHVARLGDGWLPLSVSLEDLRAGVAKIRSLREKAGRDPGDLSLVIRPGIQYRVDAETLDAHGNLSISHWIIDDPTRDPTFNALHEEMLRIAELCGLKRRIE